VDIPACFEFYNNYHMFGRRFMDKLIYHLRLGDMGAGTTYPTLCTECQECMENCPQQIEIPDRLKEVTRDFDGIGITTITWAIKKLLGRKTNSVLRSARRAEEKRRVVRGGA
jgi:predicted aldo/keto reductase-like oxidoreductase